LILDAAGGEVQWWNDIHPKEAFRGPSAVRARAVSECSAAAGARSWL